MAIMVLSGHLNGDGSYCTNSRECTGCFSPLNASGDELSGGSQRGSKQPRSTTLTLPTIFDGSGPWQEPWEHRISATGNVTHTLVTELLFDSLNGDALAALLEKQEVDQRKNSFVTNFLPCSIRNRSESFSIGLSVI